MALIKQFMVTCVVFFSIDILWLAFVARRIYQKHIGLIMADKVNVVAALIFYIIFIIGLLYFVINPAIAKESFKVAVLAGMFFGFITYSTYDLTNLATLKNWPLTITIIDITWGTLLCGTVSGISYLLLK